MTTDTLTKDESIRLMQAEIERLRTYLYHVGELAMWHYDAEADPGDESPSDMTAHVNGLIVSIVREALGDA